MTTTIETIQVWADVRCPWCWIGHRGLARALERVGAPVRVDYRSFLLEPQGPSGSRRTVGEVAVSDWGMSDREWAALRERIQETGRTDGLDIRIDTARSIDSRDAHRLLKLAAARGLDAHAAWDAVFAAHLEQNLDLENWEQLAAVGARIGLEHDDVRALAESDDLGADVLADHRSAQQRGIHGVPAVVHGDRQLNGVRSTHELAAFLKAEAAGVAR